MWQYENPIPFVEMPRLAAVQVWAPNLINNGNFLTVPRDLKREAEVDMTVGYFKWKHAYESEGTILWTQAASGGCSPLAFVVRAAGTTTPSGGSGKNSIGLAHLAANRDQEAYDMGQFVQKQTNLPRFVFLVLIHYKGTGHSPEISAFGDFERGFGQPIPEVNKGILLGDTATGAVHPDGYVGEWWYAGWFNKFNKNAAVALLNSSTFQNT